MYGVIYKITNTTNDKFYIGQTIMRLSARWAKHKQDARNGAGWVMAAAIRKHGHESFVIEVLEQHDSKDALNEAEVRCIAELKPHYNSCAGGGGIGSPTQAVRDKISRAQKGRKVSEQTKRNMSKAQKGHPVSAETVAKIQNSLQPYYAKLREERSQRYALGLNRKPKKLYVSPLQDYYDKIGATTKKEKIAAAAKLGYETGSRKKHFGVANPMYGKQKPQEIKNLLSEKMKNEGNPFYGKSHSDDTRAKMREAHASRPSVNCPHCGKQGKLNAMKRWHFDNCRSKHDD